MEGSIDWEGVEEGAAVGGVPPGFAGCLVGDRLGCDEGCTELDG